MIAQSPTQLALSSFPNIYLDPLCRLLSVKSVARMLGKSERFVWGLHAKGAIPAPVRLGRSVNWRREDIDLWIQLGCPGRDEFEQMRKAGKA